MKDDKTEVREPASEATVLASAPTVQLATAPAEEYLAGVRSALSDLPAPEVADILDDVRMHLADLADELGESAAPADLAALTARLGTPATYAAELRAAAGYPPAPRPEESLRSGRGAARFALVGLVGSTLLVTLGATARVPEVVLLGLFFALIAMPALVRDGRGMPTVATLPIVRRVVASRPVEGTAARSMTDFLASLQPGWWLVRALAAAGLVATVLVHGEEWALPLALLAAPLSVWLGRRTRLDRRLLWAVVPLNGLAAGLVLVLLTGSAFGSRDSGGPTVSSLPGLWQDSDRQIHDIRPVDPTGKPLTGIYLFDQDGRPIDTTGGEECTYRPAGGATGTVPSTPDPNRPYPRGTVNYDRTTGSCVLTPPAPLVVAVPSAAPAAPVAPAVPSTAPAAPSALPAPISPPPGSGTG